ncbi:MAG: sigma 54-interacting transcriptional regulator, partial [Bacteroidota bacterium]|nr:sigma 54-interacting transcriptional regulator [Bacteroidota bacterium]
GEYIRVGSSKVQKTDVRVIAATNKDLLEFTHTGRFREDLYYRLNTVPIRVPALRDRKEDIPLLFRKFAVDFADRYKSPPIQLDEEAKNVLASYPWPGNVRQLKNIAEQTSVLAKDKNITGGEMKKFLPETNFTRLPVLSSASPQGSNQKEFNNEREILYKLFFDVKKDVTELKRMFFDVMQNPSPMNGNHNFQNENLIENYRNEQSTSGLSHQPVVLNNNDIDKHQEVEESLSIMDAEKDLIIKALKKHRGKRRDASSDLGISERTLYRKLKEYNINE